LKRGVIEVGAAWDDIVAEGPASRLRLKRDDIKIGLNVSPGYSYRKKRTESSPDWTAGPPTGHLPGHGRTRFAHDHLHAPGRRQYRTEAGTVGRTDGGTKAGTVGRTDGDIEADTVGRTDGGTDDQIVFTVLAALRMALRFLPMNRIQNQAVHRSIFLVPSER
jgi:hypothetical protein